MNDIRDIQLHRLFAQQPLPEPEPALVEAVMASVERERRNARLITGLVALCVLIVAAALAPVVTTYVSQAFETATLGVAGVRNPGLPLASTLVMALALVGAAAWAIRS